MKFTKMIVVAMTLALCVGCLCACGCTNQNVNEPTTPTTPSVKPTEPPKPTEPVIDDRLNYMLKPGASFYWGVGKQRDEITSFTFTNVAPEKYDEQWDSTENKTGKVIGYRNGTDVYIVGEKIVFNENSGFMFCVDHFWSNLKEINGLAFVDTSLVTNTHAMFRGGKDFKQLDVGTWNMSNVSDMGEMFAGCASLTSIDVSNWDVSNVHPFYRMFDGCSSLESLNVTKWQTINASKMDRMFAGCSSLTTLDLSSFTVTNVETMKEMFEGCSATLSLIGTQGWPLGR